MLINFCLFLIAVAGGLLAAINPEPLGLQSLGDTGPAHYWLYAMKSFVVPLCLMLVNWKQKLLGRVLTLLWSGWILVLSILVVLSMNESIPSITLYGVITFTCVLIVALALVVFAIMELSRQRQQITLDEAKARQAAKK